MIIKKEQLVEREKYNAYSFYCNNFDELKEMHLGQFKLLLTEIHFLSKYSSSGDLVLYIGAARGHHIGILSELFPHIKFHLYDKTKFDVKESNNIKIFNRYFNDNLAYKYAKMDEKILLICDMRNLEIRNIPQGINNEILEQYDNLTNGDMIFQEKWCQIIKPKAASLKFRLPYISSLEYLTGDIYLQVYAPVSTEARLFTTEYFTKKTYDGVESDDQFFYFNCYLRYTNTTKNKRILKILTDLKLKKIWDNIYAIMICNYYLKKMGSNNSSKSIKDLFMRLYDNLAATNMKKYSVIFE